MKRVLLLTNIPAPYRVDLFYYLQKNIEEYEFYVLYCAKEADNRCWHVDSEKLINTSFINSKIVKIKTKYDTRHIYIPTGLFKELKLVKPDVVVGWEYGPVSAISLLWCKINKIKYINLTDGTLFSERNINLLQKLTRRLIIGKCDAAIASSTKAKEKLMKWGLTEDKIFLSLLTVDIRKICMEKKSYKPGCLLYVGSMIQRKGLDLLISALRYVNHDFELRIVGNGTKKEINDIRNRIFNANIKGKVVFCGFKEGDELVKEYQNAQFFVLPTREDCFGLVLLEALCSQLPIISSKFADGAYDIIEEGKNGVLIDPYDSKEFGKVIDKCLSEEISLVGENKEITDKFKFEEVAKGYIAAIRYSLMN